MQYQSDYVLRVIEQMGALLRRALDNLRPGGPEEPYDLAQQALGLAMDIDPDTVARLAPQGLVALLEIDTPDDRVIRLIADAFEVQAEALELNGDFMGAQLRREQALAVRGMLDGSHVN